MINLFSRYHPRYVRSLVYMLQASEYHIGDYLRWVLRTNDFLHVEKRKAIVWTGKAKALYALAWIMLLVWVVGVMAYVGSTGSDVPLVVGALVVVITPLFLPYAILLPLFIIRVVQWPIESYVISRARRILGRHRGLKLAIAGSYGKTSMREILKTVLSEGRKVAAPPGSFNTPLGIAQFASTLTGDEDVLIFELGEYYPGDIRTLSELVRPQWGIITGVNEAHLEKFGTLERTADTVFELAECVDPLQLYVNVEDKIVRPRLQKGNVPYTREYVGAWQISDAKTDLSGTAFRVTNGTSIFKAHSKLLGLHMAGSLVVAVDIASRIGLTIAQIENGIAKTKPFAHRLEPRTWGDGITLLDDSYNGNPDGVAAVIEFLSGLSSHRRWYVTPGLVEMGARKEAVHHDIGTKLAAANIEKVALVRDSVTPFIEKGLKEAGYKGELAWYNDMPHALEAIRHSTVSGDVVLIQNDWPDQYA